MLNPTLDHLNNFPATRYMGSKQKLLGAIWQAVEGLSFHSVLDAFCGTSSVAYLFKSRGKQVIANDLMHFCYHAAHSLIANNTVRLSDEDASILLSRNPDAPTFIQETFGGMYFSDEDNRFLDETRANIDLLIDPTKQSLALAALVRACIKKRPRGIFAYTGFRYDDGRRDIQMNLREHFARSMMVYNDAVFDNGQHNQAFNCDVFALELPSMPDLVYIDPPYYSPRSDSDYVRRYHFVEGLVRKWKDVTIQWETKTRKIAKYATEFDGRAATYAAFPRLFERFKDSILVVSYSSNSLPSKDELIDMLYAVGKRVRVVEVDYKYSFGTQYADGKTANDVQEYLFIAT